MNLSNFYYFATTCFFQNAECISGRCESFGHFINQVYKTCVGKAGYGSSCNEDSDCMNDSCTWGFICGDPCIPGHSDCASNQYCSALSMGTCLDKQADGTGCIPGFHQCENTCLLGKRTWLIGLASSTRGCPIQHCYLDTNILKIC